MADASQIREHMDVVGVDHQWGLEVGVYKRTFEQPSPQPGVHWSKDVRMDKVAEGFGCHGEYVEKEEEIGPAIARAYDDGVRLTVSTEDGERQLEGSHLLSAIGRTPNTEALDTEAAGIRLDGRGFIEVDDYLRTSVPGVYAMGDIRGGPAFTHASYDDYRILHTNLIRHGKASTRDRIVPYTVFIDPQLGRVGLTEREAQAQGRAFRVAKLPMNAVIRALETGETRGFMKAIVDADNGQILGGAVLNAEGGEIMTMIQVAMLGKLTHTDMANAIFTHPLLAEGLNSLFALFDN